MKIKRPFFYLMLFCLAWLPMQAYADASGPSWDQLEKEAQQLLRPLKEQWKSLPSARKNRLLKGARRWKSLSTGERARVGKQMKRWQKLSRQQKMRIRKQFLRFRKLPKKTQARLILKMKQFKKLPQKKRRALRKAWQALPEEVRQPLREPPAPRTRHGRRLRHSKRVERQSRIPPDRSDAALRPRLESHPDPVEKRPLPGKRTRIGNRPHPAHLERRPVPNRPPSADRPLTRGRNITPLR